HCGHLRNVGDNHAASRHCPAALTTEQTLRRLLLSSVLPVQQLADGCSGFAPLSTVSRLPYTDKHPPALPLAAQYHAARLNRPETSAYAYVVSAPVLPYLCRQWVRCWR